MKFEKIKLNEICKRITSGGTPKSSIKEYYYPKEIPWLKTAEVNYTRIYDTNTYISKEGLSKSSAKLIPQNSVIVAMYGQGDTAGRVAINKIPLCTNQACCNLIINEKLADYNFVYYALSNLYDEMVALKNGGAQPNLNAKIIKSFEIPFPNVIVQKNIAEILSKYDDLIENNQKQIKLLEEAAQRLYKEWFVDLHFPGYEDTKIVDGVPEGWKIELIGKKFKTVLGGTPSRSIAKYWNGDIPWINSGAVNNLRIIRESEFISKEGLFNSSTKMMPRHTTIVAITGATLGQVSYTEIETCANQSVVGIYDTSNIYDIYLYLFISNQIEEIILKATGGAQQHINKNIINEYEILLPEKGVMDKLNYLTKPIFEKIYGLFKMNNHLTEARDRLLPKLMSGEIEV